MEGIIQSKLSWKPHGESNLIFQDMRSIEEEDIFDIALEQLISRGVVHRTRREGITLYKLAA